MPSPHGLVKRINHCCVPKHVSQRCNNSQESRPTMWSFPVRTIFILSKKCIESPATAFDCEQFLQAGGAASRGRCLIHPSGMWSVSPLPPPSACICRNPQLDERGSFTSTSGENKTMTSPGKHPPPYSMVRSYLRSFAPAIARIKVTLLHHQ